jgi:hypothetical protein
MAEQEVEIKNEMRPALIIGVGGTGHEILMNIRKRLVQQFGSLKDCPIIQFLEMDTDQGMMSESVPDTVYMGEDISLKAGEIINLAVMGGNELRKNSAITDWFPDDLYIDNDFTKGAAGKRNFGRLAASVNADSIYKAILAAKQIAMNQGKCQEFEKKFHLDVIKEELLVFVVSSLVGGTGSGAYLDICYITRKVTSDVKKILYGYFVTGGAEADAIKKSNCYGALKELEYYSNKNSFNVKYPAKNIYEINLSDPPVDWCYLINGANTLKMIFDKNTLFELAADNIFTEITPGISNKKRSLRLDMGGTYGYGESDKFGRPQSFISFGISNIEFPAINLIDIFTYRLASEAISLWTFPEAAKMDVVKELDRDLEEWGLRVDKGQVEKFLATSDAGETLWVKLAKKQNEDLHACKDFLPMSKRSELKLKVQNDLTLNTRNVDSSLDRPGDYITTVRHCHENLLNISINNLRQKIYGIIGNTQAGGVKNALDYLESLKTRLSVYAEQHIQKRDKAQRDIVAATNRLTEEQKRFNNDLQEKEWMVTAHLEAVYKASTECQRKAIENEIHERGRLLLVGRQDSQGGWQTEGILAEVERLDKKVRVIFKDRIAGISAKFSKRFEENKNKITEPSITTEVLLSQDEINEIYKRTVPNINLATVEIKKEIEYALGEKDSPRPLLLCLLDKAEETEDSLLKAANKRFLNIKDISVADRLARMSPDEASQRISTAYKRSYPLLSINDSTRNTFCKFNPEKTHLNMIGIVDPTKDDALKQSGQVMQAIKKEIQNPFILPLLPDRYRIVFSQELGGISLKCIDSFKEYKELYKVNSGGKTRNHFQTDKRIDFPDLFPADEDDIKAKMKEPMVLAKALRIFEKKTDPVTEEDFIYYSQDSKHGVVNHQLGRDFEEVGRKLLEIQINKEVKARDNDKDTPLELIERDIKKMAIGAITLTDRENLWLELEAYLFDLKGTLKGGDLNQLYMDEAATINKYREQFKISPPKSWQKNDDPKKYLKVTAPVDGPAKSPVSAKCSNCGQPVQEGFKKCPSCGASLAAMRACPTCGKEMQAEWKVCPFC